MVHSDASDSPISYQYSIYNQSSVLLSKHIHTIDNWYKQCFSAIYPNDFKYYFGSETYLNTILPLSKKLINDLSPVVMDILERDIDNKYKYYHVFAIDISFNTRLEPKLENISEINKVLREYN